MSSSGCCPNPFLMLVEGEKDEPIPKSKSTSAACRHNFTAITTSSFYPDTHFTNHESLPSYQESFAHFIKAYPKYSETRQVDRIRNQDYYHLSISKHVCLDYIGIGLFSHSQPQCLFDVTCKSVNLKSELLHGGHGSQLELSMKRRIINFLNISSNEYAMVFTANRSSAFKLIAESYPFKTSQKLLTVYDHESEAIESMVNASEKRGAHILSAEFKWPRLRIHSAKLKKQIIRKKKKSRGLFVFPLQSRVSGGSYSYQWMNLAQENGWHVLLDACALGPKDMDSFGLSLFHPDFIICSFYKVFGENPTGFGCLLVKKSVLPILEASLSTGIVSIVSLEDSSGSGSSDLELKQVAPKVDEEESWEIECRCLDHVDSLGLMQISNRRRYLVNWLVSALLKLRHPNRLDHFPLVRIYGPKIKFERGTALAFNLLDWKGEIVEPILIQKLADRNNISLTNGFLSHLWFPDKYQQRMMVTRKGEDTKNSKRMDFGISLVTVALSFLANFEDVYRLWTFIAQFLDADFVEKERWRYSSLDHKTLQL